MIFDELFEGKHFRTAYGWAGGYNEKTGKKYRHPEQVQADLAAQKQQKSQKKQPEVKEGVNAKQIKKDLDSGMSYDAVIGKHANKRMTNTDDIRRVIQQHAWEKRMKRPKEQGVAEGSDQTIAMIKNYERELAKYKRFNANGAHDVKIKNLEKIIAHLKAKQQQGVAEGTKESNGSMYRRGWNDGIEDELDDQYRSDQEYRRGFEDGLDHAMGPKGLGRSDPKRYKSEQGVAEGIPSHIKKSDVPPAMRSRLTMRDVEAERPQGAYRYRVGDKQFMDLAAAQSFAQGTGETVKPIREVKKKLGERGATRSARIERILKMLRARNPQAQDDLEALLLNYRADQAHDQQEIDRLDAENDQEEADIANLQQTVRRRMAEQAALTKFRTREHPAFQMFAESWYRAHGGV